MPSKTNNLSEQVAFDMKATELIELFEQCPTDEYRKELFSELIGRFCLSCWCSLEEGETCHCDNDE